MNHRRTRTGEAEGQLPSPEGFAPGSEGFTLIELVVVIVLISLVMSISIPGIAALTGADMKQASRDMVGTVRAAYDESFMKNRPMRVVWNLDRNAYWVEESEGGEARIYANSDQREDDAREAEDRERQSEKLKEEREREQDRQKSNSLLLENSSDDQGFLAELVANLFTGSGEHSAVHPADYKDPNSTFAPADPERFGVRQLPEGVRIKSVLTYAYDRPVEPSDVAPDTTEEEVRVTTTIFPSGYVEDTVVTITDGDRVWSMVVDPLTGRVHVQGGEAQLPRYDERLVVD